MLSQYLIYVIYIIYIICKDEYACYLNETTIIIYNYHHLQMQESIIMFGNSLITVIPFTTIRSWSGLVS